MCFKLLLLVFLGIGRCIFADIIVNGGFETGDFTGWTNSGWFIDTTNPNSGTYDTSTGCGGASCTTVGDPNSAYIYQDITTTVGTPYDLSFFYDSGRDATFASELLVLWGDPTAPSLSTVVDLVNVDTAGAYVEYTGTVTATSATSQLEFLGRQDLDFYYLDDVSLTAPASSVPEPGTVTLVSPVVAAFFVLTIVRSYSRSRTRTGNLWRVDSRTVCRSHICQSKKAATMPRKRIAGRTVITSNS